MDIERSRIQWAIEDVINNIGMDAYIRENYSGRGMRDGSCFGIVVKNMNQAFEFFIHLHHDLAVDLAEIARIDSMGTSTIIYFPNCHLV